MSDIQNITPEVISKAKELAQKNGYAIPLALKELLQLNEVLLTQKLADTFNYQYLSMDDLRAFTPTFEVMGYAECVSRDCLLLTNASKQTLFVFSDPFNSNLQSWAGTHIHHFYQRCLATQADIRAYLAIHEVSLRATDSVIESFQGISPQASASETLSLQTINEDSNPVVKLVNSTLYDALKGEASDIHIESTVSGLSVKYRIDGALVPVASFNGSEFAEQVISRIKVMSELDISERRVPQDGRFKVFIQGREVDFRVSVMPSSHGEDAVLRILDRHAISDESKTLTLENLGFSGPVLKSIRKLIAVPYGMFLVTGPTGSGKTTTLYAALSEINHIEDKVITIEDPVEYQLEGVLQIPVNEKKGLTFARGLRSILRHDPDKIMVGEIRDPETAQIAVQSALTGHLVFTTVHANNAFDVISRFVHMGVDPYSFVSALNGVLAQRLVRVICTNCTTLHKPTDELILDSGLSLDQIQDFNFRLGQGCGQCRGSGYKGRKVISELLMLDDNIRQMIINKEPVSNIKERAFANGMRSIRDAAIDLVKAGETTLEEINRVTFVV